MGDTGAGFPAVFAISGFELSFADAWLDLRFVSIRGGEFRRTRIWADTPEPKDFVKDHRPPASRLNYQPLTGSDPERPKLRTPAELKDLETELEAARFKADKKAGIKPAAAVVSNKPRPAAVTE